MNDTFLRGRTALVTGSVQGIGLAIAQRLAGAAQSEIAEVAAMLCQTWAHNINGITTPVDGGWTAQ